MNTAPMNADRRYKRFKVLRQEEKNTGKCKNKEIKYCKMNQQH